MKTSRLRTAGALAAAMLSIQPGTSQTDAGKLSISATAVSMSNIATGSTAPVQITIDRWSTPQERAHLVATMVNKGGQALTRELQQMPSHGRMSFPSWRGPDPMNARLGWDLRYTWQEPLPEGGGRRIVVALDRYITFWEARNQPRSADYNVTLIELRVDNKGEGEGRMAFATKIRFDKDKNVVELETYASEPVRLQNVRVTSNE